MATSSKILLTTEDVGVFNLGPQKQEAASKASELLQKNHEVFLSEYWSSKHITDTLRNIIFSST
jgi:hypothetical protein